MIARELLVKLGFDVDEGKFKRFTQNVDALKTNMSGIKSKISLDVDSEKLNRFKQQAREVKAEISHVQGRFGLNIDKGGNDKVKNISRAIIIAKAKMIDLRKQINQRIYPEIDTKSLAAYRKELAALSEKQRQEVLDLNKIERDSINDQLSLLKEKCSRQETGAINLDKTKAKIKESLTIANKANVAFSRFFARVALIGAGSGLLALRNTLKDAQNFKMGGGKTNNSFTGKQLKDVDRFNVSLKQLKKTLGELRNKFVIGLLPAFKENIDSLNELTH